MGLSEGRNGASKTPEQGSTPCRPANDSKRCAVAVYRRLVCEPTAADNADAREQGCHEPDGTTGMDAEGCCLALQAGRLGALPSISTKGRRSRKRRAPVLPLCAGRASALGMGCFRVRFSTRARVTEDSVLRPRAGPSAHDHRSSPLGLVECEVHAVTLCELGLTVGHRSSKPAKRVQLPQFAPWSETRRTPAMQVALSGRPPTRLKCCGDTPARHVGIAGSIPAWRTARSCCVSFLRAAATERANDPRLR